MSFETTLSLRVKGAEEIILSFLPEDTGYAATVKEAMRYALSGGGKRIRPVLMQEAFFLSGGAEEKLLHPFMAAMEMIHTYSLVHDDLPAMDDDDLRRGRATTHVVYGEGMGILAGDALLNYAYETALLSFDAAMHIQGPDETHVEIYKRIARALTVLSAKAGIHGMVGGQCADLIGERCEKEMKIAPDNERLSGKGTEEELLYIHTHKTSALLEASLMCGAILGGAPDEAVSCMEQAGNLTGLAFQIRDDILDATGDEATLGKKTGQDEKNCKTTYVSLHGIESAKTEVERLSNEALSQLEKAVALNAQQSERAKDAAAFLKDLILWMTERNY
ncbi:MAG: polyprenyl synthetase family protein [Lachnospiraceae bacterium]|nr:polyprenyl synthetase family protein [Lachnospiraceae bacterium]